MCGTNFSNEGFGLGIVKMAKIPGQKIIDTMHSGYRNVQSVIQSLGRKGSLPEKCHGQFHHGLRHWKYEHIG